MKPRSERRLLGGLLLFAAFFAAPVRGDDGALIEQGKSIYKKANCIGCHKWHGDGGGGYGGAAVSLRSSQLDEALTALVIRCGRPGTGMPYHWRQAYDDPDKACYGADRAAMGEAMPPRAARFVSDRQLDALMRYLAHAVRGKGKPSHDECVAFWGESSRQCDTYKP